MIWVTVFYFIPVLVAAWYLNGREEGLAYLVEESLKESPQNFFIFFPAMNILILVIGFLGWCKGMTLVELKDYVDNHEENNNDN